ncbi:hypothetical protein SAMN05444365_104462 [Micromonospora pattaloongensis]|uniref:Uncharacterized protein n=1 Tax=Micromonospora pattaloongensis TaxID=405436 RepID=A0A1H3PD96_9ACTN|nr:hypothetical protein [Micromonospora pattaloongensis]SDY99037.1 hypothetical protein SAMN05444365_104462 [Micromonospora pattaloongensis]
MYQPEENSHKSRKTDDVLLRGPGRKEPEAKRLPPPPPAEEVLSEPVGRVTRRDGVEPAAGPEPPE